jgi:1,4-dihydroxy-2-naphthoate octaprenyltransferase
LIKHLATVYKNKNPKELDPELKKVALSTFVLSILLSLSFIFFFQDIFVNLFMGGR